MKFPPSRNAKLNGEINYTDTHTHTVVPPYALGVGSRTPEDTQI